MKENFLRLIVFVSTLAGFVGCKKNEATLIPVYTIPTTYNFTGADYTAQTKVLLMADALVTEINLPNTAPNTPVTAARLNDLFNNTNSSFCDATLSATGIKLSAYLTDNAKAAFQTYFDNISFYSASSAKAAEGVPGVGSSTASPSKKFLLSANGHFCSQVIKKTIMGMFADQIANVSPEDSINGATNIAKLGHYRDAALGLFGVPLDFPGNVTGLKYFGSCSNQVSVGLNSKASIMTVFLKGRAAITANDLVTMKTQAGLLIKSFDRLNAACIVQEMHETNEHIEAGYAVAAYGTLSESLGFVGNLKYNTGVRVIMDAQIIPLLQLFDNPTHLTRTCMILWV